MDKIFFKMPKTWFFSKISILRFSVTKKSLAKKSEKNIERFSSKVGKGQFWASLGTSGPDSGLMINFVLMTSKDETDHYASFGSGPMFWKNLHPELWIIFR